MIKLRHQGMTLLEILIAAGLFAAFMTAVAFFFARSSQLFSTGEKFRADYFEIQGKN